MPSRLTLHKVTENLIQESRASFSPEDYERRLKKRWPRKIADSTLDALKRQLPVHERLIEIAPEKFLPSHVVFEKIQKTPLSVRLGELEIQGRFFIPGCRLVPFLPSHLKEKDLTILNATGEEIPKFGKKFHLDEILDFYRYCEESHFPDHIKVNETCPGKSSVSLTVWDLRGQFSDSAWKAGPRFYVELLDYERGVYRMRPYPSGEWSAHRLINRGLYVAMEQALSALAGEENFFFTSMEKQLLRVFYGLSAEQLNVPAFSLAEFLESLEALSVLGYEEGGPHFVPCEDDGEWQYSWEPLPMEPKGATGSIGGIFEELGFPFDADEFKAILYTVLGSADYELDEVFQLLFGGKDDRFQNPKQRSAFYRHLRKLLSKIFFEKQEPELKAAANLRDGVVQVKLKLVEMLRYLESQDISLPDLPGELLDQIIDLDHFCAEILAKFKDRSRPPDLKTIRYTRLALNIVQPNLSRLEEDIYYQLGVY